VRAKPPLPAISGLFGKPTVINNVISLASVPIILRAVLRFIATTVWVARAALYRYNSRAISNLVVWSRKPSVSRLREMLYDFGGGTRSGREIRAVQVGGPLGAYLPNHNSIRRSITKPF
jgi:formate dehydrogenase iron-sulfur subunit